MPKNDKLARKFLAATTLIGALYWVKLLLETLISIAHCTAAWPIFVRCGLIFNANVTLAHCDVRPYPESGYLRALLGRPLRAKKKDRLAAVSPKSDAVF
jgi:hypothetical protein